MSNRLFIVSNRMPASVGEEGIKPASGGLVTAISSYLTGDRKQEFSEVFWCGVPGCDASTWRELHRELSNEEFTYLPVFTPGETYESYYNGFSNSMLWPLFHYFPSYVEYNSDCFENYIKVNQAFADTLTRWLSKGDTVWIHDYHLLPLASMLRQAIPELSIGFFLHIPFPSFEIFRLMPKKWQQEILKGMLGADLIGFHTIDYAAHFIQSIQMVLSLDSERNTILYDNRLIKVDVFPISIDFKKFNDAFDDEKVISLRAALREQIGDRKILFSVDRLDYTKGVQNRLQAYEHFLKSYPEYQEKVVFILVIVPSRDTIQTYIERKKSIDETISQINSSIGNIGWMPVIYNYNTLDFENMVALYSACDLALITPLRDGMNLVSKEFVASRKDKKGVLILSEMAGSARELTHALTINPNDVGEIAERIREGLEMPEELQSVCMEKMQLRVSTYDVQAWAEEFMLELRNVKRKQEGFQIRFIDEYARRDIYDAYRQAERRLLLLDYDGTLMPFRSNPDEAVPDLRLLDILRTLCEAKGNDVFLISGRSSQWLEKHFGNLPINLVAEHGARYRVKGENWASEIQTFNEWKEKVHNIMDMYVRRCANTFKEEKEYSMVWHFRNANAEEGKLRAYELASDLNDYVHNRHLQVLLGNKIVEVRQSGVNKGSFVRKQIHKKTYDFIMAVGDDRTDEDMFRELVEVENAFSVKIGPEASYAKYNLYTPQMFVSMLEGFCYFAERDAFYTVSKPGAMV